MPGIREVMTAAGNEAIRTPLALGHQLVPIFGKSHVEENDPSHYATALLDTVLSEWTLPNTRVAHLQDWMKGRRAEVDEINGIVVAEQQTMGGTAPVNATLVDIAYRIERGELKADPSNAALLLSTLQPQSTVAFVRFPSELDWAFAKIKNWMRMAQRRSIVDTWRHVGRLT